MYLIKMEIHKSFQKKQKGMSRLLTFGKMASESLKEKR